MYSVRKAEAKLLDLPGRDVRVFIGTGPAFTNVSSDHLTVGLTEVGPEVSMTPHVHDDKEEIIFIVEGEGEAVVGDSVEKLEPFTAVKFPIGVTHVVKNTSKKTMRFVFCFNPPNSFGR